MSRYNRIKIGEGRFKMVQVADSDEVETVELTPPEVTAGGSTARFKCKLCSRQFKHPGPAAMHFGKAHKDSPGTWRSYMEESGAHIGS